MNTTPTPLQWVASRTGPMTASIEHGGKSLWLCSRYDPVEEAEKFVERVDMRKNACTVVLGVGVGYHVARLASRMSSTLSLVIAFEPDLSQLRAVLEEVDHTEWLGRNNVILADAQMDRAGLIKRIDSFTGMLTQGTELVTHVPSRSLHGNALNSFGKIVTEVIQYCRTNMATAMVNASRTFRNLSMNLHQYAAGMNTNELFQAAAGCPAVCVGAGPSLSRNMKLLTDPETRSRIVLITVQTMLKPLLAAGIRPDFVTALDYHHISTRFYEGLDELPDVTLVAQPLVHPAVVDCFPGPVRMTQSRFLDLVLEEHARPIRPMPAGATVSHLSFYLAQYLGCDPIIMIGLDLGFSDGLYYFPGTAIHDVWAPELGPFNTLEMMEWQRIVRHRGLLHKRNDIHGRPIYSDEQMITYLKQFERDFADAPQTVIDATEGGVPKDHTTRQTLAEALDQYAKHPAPALPQSTRDLDANRLRVTATALRQRRSEVTELRHLSHKALPLLNKMLKHQDDKARMDKLFATLQPILRRVEQLSNTFDLVNSLNTIGAFNRARADRSIEIDEINDLQRQRQRIERDLENVEWLSQSCDEFLNMIRDSLKRVDQFGQSQRVKNPVMSKRKAKSLQSAKR